MAVIRSLGGNAYTDVPSIDAHPDWNADNGVTAELEAFLPNTQPGERWFRSSVQGGNPMEGTAAAIPSNEFEFSCVLRKSDEFPPLQLMRIYLQGNSGLETMSVSTIDTIPSTNSFVLFTEGAGTLQGPGARMFTDRNYYTTLRYRKESSLGANDGRIELWAHDELIYFIDDYDASTGGHPTWTTANAHPRIQASTFTRNIVLQDSWSSADGVAPVPQLVADNGDLTETVTPTTYDTFYVAPVFPDFYLDELLATGDTSNFTLNPDLLTFSNAVSYMTIPANTAAHKSSGAWFWQTTMITGGGGGEDNATGIAVPGSLPAGYLGQGATHWGYYENGSLWNGGGSTQYTALSDGDVVDHYLDLDNLTYSLGINGGAPFQIATLVGGTTYTPAISNRNGESTSIAFDVADLTIPVPAGFSAFVIPTLAWDANNQHNSSASLSNGDRTALTDAGTAPANRLTILATSDLEIPPGTGIYYWETVCDVRILTAGWGVGVIDASDPPVGAPSEAMGTNASRLVHVAYSDSGYRANGTINGSNGIGWTNGDVVRHLANRDTGVYSVARDGQPLHAFATLLDPAATYLPHFHSAAVGEQTTLRTTSAEFTGAIPPGAVALGDPPLPSADGDLNIAAVRAEIVTGLAHVGSLDISNVNAEIVTDLSHAGSLDISHVSAEILTGLSHVGSLDISRARAEIVTNVGPEFYGLPPVVVPQEVSNKFDDFCDDERDYATFDEETAARDNLIALQAAAAQLIAQNALMAGERTAAFSTINPMPIETPQLVRKFIDSYELVQQTDTRTTGRVGMAADRTIVNGELIKLTITNPLLIEVETGFSTDLPTILEAEAEFSALQLVVQNEFDSVVLPLYILNSLNEYIPVTHYTVNQWNRDRLNIVYVWWDTNVGQARVATGPIGYPNESLLVINPAIDSDFCAVESPDIGDIPSVGDLTSGLLRNVFYEAQNAAQTNALRMYVREAALYDLVRIYFDETTGQADRDIEVVDAEGTIYFYTRSDFTTPLNHERPIIRTVGSNIYRILKHATLATSGQLELVATSKSYHGVVACPPGYTPPPRGTSSVNRILLRESFPYPIRQGDQFVLIEGCDKTWETCRGRYDNALNFGGQPFLPGEDRLVQQVNFRRTTQI